jgi:hypothetical protein
LKVSGTQDDFISVMPPPLQQSIIRVFSEEEHPEAYEMVIGPGWALPREPYPEAPPEPEPEPEPEA